LATEEAESRKIAVGSQPRQIVCETLSSQKRAGGVAQGEGPEFKPQYCKKQNKTPSKLKNGHKHKLKNYLPDIMTLGHKYPINLGMMSTCRTRREN
jgi:hypothetical protein